MHFFSSIFVLSIVVSSILFQVKNKIVLFIYLHKNSN